MKSALKKLQDAGYKIFTEDVNEQGLGWHVLEKDGEVVAEIDHYCSMDEAINTFRKHAPDELERLGVA